MDFFRKPLQLTRTNPGTRDSKGRFVPHVTPTFPVMVNASVQSTGAKSPTAADQAVMAELNLTSLAGVLKVFSSQAVYSAQKETDEHPARPTGDRFKWDGELYEIRSVSNPRNLIPRWEAYAVLVDEKTA